MKTAALALLLLLLTGCGKPGTLVDTQNDRFTACINAGGSYREDYGGGWSCTLPETRACTQETPVTLKSTVEDE